MSSERRDLHTGEPVWAVDGVPHLPTDDLPPALTVDVLVIGSGISGALVAEALVRAGREVAIVDRRKPARGSTAASTALLLHEIDTPLNGLAAKIGRTRAERAWRRSRLSVRALEQLTRDLGLDADLAARPSLYLAGTELDAAGLEAEAEARARIGLDSAFLDAAAVKARFGIDREAAIVSGDSYEVDPPKLAAGILRACLAAGVRLYSPVTVERVSSEGGRVVAVTDQGLEITCRHLVFATGYERADQVPEMDTSVTSTWVIATAPQPERLWPERAMIWEASDPYLYIRATADGRVVCGGEDEEFEDEDRRDAKIADKAATLSKKLARLLPGIDPTPDFAWAGSFGQSETGLPRIGPVPGLENCYAVLGYGGNGFTFSMIAAEIISRAIAEETDPDADLFAFG